MKKSPFILFIAAALSLSACAGSGTPTRYYTLAASGSAKATAKLPYNLVVKKFSVDPAYNQTHIVYRESPYDFMAYNNDLWATNPEHQVATVLAEELKHSGLFSKIELRATEIPDLELAGFLVALEEVDVDSSERFARVALELSLRDVKKDTLLWKKTYDENERLAGTEPREIAKAASVLVNRYAEDAVREFERILSGKAESAEF